MFIGHMNFHINDQPLFPLSELIASIHPIDLYIEGEHSNYVLSEIA